MKNLIFVSALFLPLFLSAQVDKSRLDGYWAWEAVDSTHTKNDKKALPNKHILRFSGDTLLMSNFGDQLVAQRALTWSCTKSTWLFSSDTIHITPIKTLLLSTNTGIYSMSNKAAVPYFYVIKSQNKNVLVLEIRRPKAIQLIKDVESGNVEMEIIQRTYHKVADVNICGEYPETF